MEFSSNFLLQVSGFSGTAGDSLGYHNARGFTTMDRDNDLSAHNCAIEYSSSWWFNRCINSNLNGRMIGFKHKYSGAQWIKFKGANRECLMKIYL